MADLIWPMESPDGEPIRYAQRDIIGVETNPTIYHRGFNEAMHWVRRQRAALLREHRADGSHNTLKIARATIILSVQPSVGGMGEVAVQKKSWMDGHDTPFATADYLGIGSYRVHLLPFVHSDTQVRCAVRGTNIRASASISAAKTITVFRYRRSNIPGTLWEPWDFGGPTILHLHW